MQPMETGPLAGEWTPKRLLYLASASTIEPLAATLNELGRLAEADATLEEIADAIFNSGAGRKKAEREDFARRLNAIRASLSTIRLAAEGR